MKNVPSSHVIEHSGEKTEMIVKVEVNLFWKVFILVRIQLKSWKSLGFNGGSLDQWDMGVDS